MQTIKAHRTRLRRLAYTLGWHGEWTTVMYVVVARDFNAPRVTERAGSFGRVLVP